MCVGGCVCGHHCVSVGVSMANHVCWWVCLSPSLCVNGLCAGWCVSSCPYVLGGCVNGNPCVLGGHVSVCTCVLGRCVSGRTCVLVYV